MTTAEEQPHAFAVMWSLQPLGGFVGSLLGGVLPALFARAMGTSLDAPGPYRYPLMIGAAALVPIGIALLATRDVDATEAKQRTVEMSPAPYAAISVLAMVCLLRVGGESTASTFFNVYMDAELAVSAARIGTVMAIANLLTVPAPLRTPPLVARWGRVGAVVAGAVGVTASLALLGLGPHWGAAALAFVGMKVLAAIARTVITLFGQELVRREWRPLTMGANNPASGLATFAASTGGGYIVTGLDYHALFLIGAATVAMGALLFWLYFRVPRAEMAAPAVAIATE